MARESKTDRQNEFQDLFDSAMNAGRAAALAATPHPMIVGTAKSLFGTDIDHTQPVFHVPEGVCGFAWIIVKPGTSAFAKWLKASGRARPDSYYGGVNIWIRDYNQSMTRKEAHANAMASVLTKAGVNAYAMSRMD